MKLLLAVLLLSLPGEVAHAQGTLWFINIGARTRLGTADGPYAGTNIAARALAGFTTDSLTPVGPLFYHRATGLIAGNTMAIPWAPGYAVVWIQMVAWDASVWGTQLSAVPENQLGKTDTVQLELVWQTQPPDYPHWTQPAIIPPVPEPPVALLGLVGLGMFLLRHRQRNRQGP